MVKNFDNDVIEEDVVEYGSVSNMPGIRKANPMPEVESDEEESSTSTKSSSKRKIEKDEIDVEDLIKYLIINFEKMDKCKRILFLTNLIGSSPSGVAKRFSLNPSNRLMLSVKGEQPISTTTAKSISEFVKESSVVKSHKELYEKITPEVFVSPKVFKEKNSVSLPKEDVEYIKSALKSLKTEMFN